MSKKDYIALAHALNTGYSASLNADDNRYEMLERIANNIADVLKADNSNFDRAKFLAACGVD